MLQNDDELTNTDLDSNKVVYVSNNHLVESPIKVEDESEDMIPSNTPGRSVKQSRKNAQDSKRSSERP
jgi:hypothetical protein